MSFQLPSSLTDLDKIINWRNLIEKINILNCGTSDDWGDKILGN